MNNELSDEDLKQILTSNTKHYSHCEWLEFLTDSFFFICKSRSSS